MGKAVTCMLYLMVFFACFGSLTNIGLRTVEQCPSNEIEWETRSEEFHCRENQDRYDCLRIKHTKKFIEGCIVDNGIRGRYTNGTYPVYDEGARMRDTLFCPPHRYQNVSYYANQPGLDWCPYEKSNCTGDGQVTVENALVHHEDNICICDNGYILNPEYQAKGSCNPGTDDCCFKNNTKDPKKKERTDWQIYIVVVASILFGFAIALLIVYKIYKRRHTKRNRRRTIDDRTTDNNFDSNGIPKDLKSEDDDNGAVKVNEHRKLPIQPPVKYKAEIHEENIYPGELDPLAGSSKSTESTTIYIGN